MFDDLIEANDRYAAEFHDSGVEGKAAKGLAVLTCIDSRIDPLRMLGLKPGDAKIVRNAGARVTGDALRSLILAANLLNVSRICVVQHTDCAMAGATDEQVAKRVTDASGADASGYEFLAMTDQAAALRADLARLRQCELIPASTEIAGFTFDVRSGRLVPLDG